MTACVLIYLHGFNSSPQSAKAQQMRDFLSSNYPNIELVMPQIALTPDGAWQQLDRLVAHYRSGQYSSHQMGFVGSSLGGFFSTILANKYGGKAVLVNPAVRPHLIGDIIKGKHLHPELNIRYEVGDLELRQLASLDWISVKQVENFWLLLQQGDETLDYRLAVTAYDGAKMTIEPAGNHGFVGFSRFLNPIVKYLFDMPN